MDRSGVAFYWLSRSGAEPPPEWRGEDFAVAPTTAAPGEAAAVFLTARPETIASACGEIRQKLGAAAYIVLVADEAGGEAAELIGDLVDDVCPAEACGAPALLARVKARARERLDAARSLAALGSKPPSTRCRRRFSSRTSMSAIPAATRRSSDVSACPPTRSSARAFTGSPRRNWLDGTRLRIAPCSKRAANRSTKQRYVTPTALTTR